MATNALSLFVLSFGVAGIITFFGYLMIAPLIPVGDTGRVFSLLGVPIVIQVVFSIIAVFCVTLILMKSTKYFERYAIEDFGSLSTNRKRWSIALILVPLILSIAIVTLLQFPIPHIASIIATVCAPFSIMAVFGTFIGSKKEINRSENGSSINKRISIPLLTFFILVIIAIRMLVSGS